MPSLMSWTGSAPLSRDSGMLAASILQLHHLGAVELFWHNPTPEEGRLHIRCLATWPSSDTYRF